MKFWIKLACRLFPVLVLLACAGGGGGGGLAKDQGNQDTNNTNITGGTGYETTRHRSAKKRLCCKQPVTR